LRAALDAVIAAEPGTATTRGSGEPGGTPGERDDEGPRGPRRTATRGAGGRRGLSGRQRRARDDADDEREPHGPDDEFDTPEAGARARTPDDPEAVARAVCLRLLSGRARTRSQLADALRRREIPDDVAEFVLGRFTDVGLIDDTAFADAWVDSRHTGKGLARRALARELRQRGVDATVVDEAIARLDPDQEAETARALVARRLRATRGLDRDKRIRRLAGMLARKGYGEGLAIRVVRDALATEAAEDDG